MEFKKPDIKSVDRKKFKWIILIPLILLTLAVSIYAGSGADEGEGVIVTTESASAEEEQLSADRESGGRKADLYIYVDVSGAVNTPMVVCIPEGSRVFEAIDAAGGRSADASVRTLNLAAICEDGQKIYVPNMEEVKAGYQNEQSQNYQTGSTVSDDSESSASKGAGSTSVSDSSSAKGRVNINTAGSEELQTLTGVGPAIASRIIDYRNKNGSFKSTDEITNVSGIGEKTYEKFKDEICV